MTDPIGCVDINTQGTLIVLEEAARANVKKLCFSSSAAIYGDNPTVPKTEDMLPEPKSPYAVTGIYCYDSRVFDVVRRLRPSERGELEITDVNNWYIGQGELSYEVLEGWWTDAGTFESLYRAAQFVAGSGVSGTRGPRTRAGRPSSERESRTASKTSKRNGGGRRRPRGAGRR